MTITIVTLLLLVCLAVLAYPFFVPHFEMEVSPDPARDIMEQIRRSRERVYEEIRMLQQEHFLNNLTEEEYQSQLQAARRRAAELVRQQQQVQNAFAEAEADVEGQMLNMAGHDAAITASAEEPEGRSSRG